MAGSIREALETAYEEGESEEPEAGGSEEGSEEPVGSAPTLEEVAGDEADGKKPIPEPGKDDEPAPDPDPAEVPGSAEGEGEAAGDQLPEGSEEPTNEELAAPVGWKAGAREVWKDVPAAIKSEIHRREQDIRDALQGQAEHRKTAEEFKDIVYPYEPLVAQQGVTPMQAVKEFFQTSAGLTLGTPQQKAGIIARVIKQYGVSIEELDTVLSGEVSGVTPESTTMSNMIAEQLAPINQFMTEINNTRQTSYTQSEARRKAQLKTFANTHEFYQDVRLDMADLMDLASNRGESLSLDKAYEKAVAMNPDLTSIVAGRRQADSAGKRQQEIDKKKKAASSLGSQGEGEGGNGAETLRGAITEAWEGE